MSFEDISNFIQLMSMLFCSVAVFLSVLFMSYEQGEQCWRILDNLSTVILVTIQDAE